MDRFEFPVDPKNDMYVGLDGCHYFNVRSAVYFSHLNLCGCGNSDDIHGLLVECMEAIEDHRPHERVEKIEVLVSENVELVAEFIMHFLDSKKLTEHGTSVSGSWATPLGKHFVEIGPMRFEDEPS